MTQLFDLNARIQQLTWSLIFYEKYSTSLSTIELVVLTTANFGGFSNFCRYYTRSQAGKSTGYRPTLKPLLSCSFTSISFLIKSLFLYFNLCLSVMLDSLSCSFTITSTSYLTNWYNSNIKWSNWTKRILHKICIHSLCSYTKFWF
jgi:hypothetical protein